MFCLFGSTVPYLCEGYNVLARLRPSMYKIKGLHVYWFFCRSVDFLFFWINTVRCSFLTLYLVQGCLPRWEGSNTQGSGCDLRPTRDKAMTANSSRPKLVRAILVQGEAPQNESPRPLSTDVHKLMLIICQ